MPKKTKKKTPTILSGALPLTFHTRAQLVVAIVVVNIIKIANISYATYKPDQWIIHMKVYKNTYVQTGVYTYIHTTKIILF